MPYVKIKSKGQVTIPMKVCKQLDLKEGDTLEITVKDNLISLEPQEVISRRLIDESIAEGLDDYKAGRVHGPYDSMDDFKESLTSDA